MELNKLISKNNFQFKKQFGQNFISDANLLLAIVKDAGITKDDVVVEIGAGAGTLTSILADNAKKVISFEIDKKLEPILDEVLEEKFNVELVFCDFMTVKHDALNALTKGKFKVVANLPYYITTPIVMHLFESGLDIESITIMVQEEVADRFTAKANTKDYGAITVMTNLVSNAVIARKVPRTVFFPQPNVDSAVVRFDVNKNKFMDTDYKKIRRLVKCAFGNRRKTLVNNISGEYAINKDKVKDILVSMNINENIRGEALSVSQFVELSKIIG